MAPRILMLLRSPVTGISGGCPTRLQVACSRSEEHTSELQSLRHLVCRLLLEKKHNGSSTAMGTRTHRGGRVTRCAGWPGEEHAARRSEQSLRRLARGMLYAFIVFFLKSGPPPDHHFFPHPPALPN